MFRDKVCIITGASSGLGKSLALHLAKEKATVVLFARSEPQLKEVSEACQKEGANTLVVCGDITKAADCLFLIDQVIQEFQQIDYLINNAGLSMWSAFSDISELDAFEKLIAVNYLGSVYCTHFALPYLIKSKGLVVAISSLQGRYGVPYHTGYSAAKHAVHGFFNALRFELSNKDVGVLIVTPGWLQGTNLRANALVANEEKKFRHQSSKSGISLEVCSKTILNAMIQRKKELCMPKKMKLLFLLDILFPRLAAWYVLRRVKQET